MRLGYLGCLRALCAFGRVGRRGEQGQQDFLPRDQPARRAALAVAAAIDEPVQPEQPVRRASAVVDEHLLVGCVCPRRDELEGGGGVVETHGGSRVSPTVVEQVEPGHERQWLAIARVGAR